MAQFNVNLAFNADTGKAKTQIQELQSLLSKIAYSGTTSMTGNMQKDLKSASDAAKELQFHLNNGVWDSVNSIYTYKNSAMGVIENLSADYSSLDFDAAEIQKKLGDGENVEFLKEVLTKLG